MACPQCGYVYGLPSFSQNGKSFHSLDMKTASLQCASSYELVGQTPLQNFAHTRDKDGISDAGLPHVDWFYETLIGP